MRLIFSTFVEHPYSPTLRAAVVAMLTELTDAELLLLVPHVAAVKGEPRELLLAELKTRTKEIPNANRREPHPTVANLRHLLPQPR